MTEGCKYLELVKRLNLLNLNIMLMLFDFCCNQPIFVITPGIVTRPVPDGVVDFPEVVVGMLRTVGPLQRQKECLPTKNLPLLTRVLLITQSNEI